MEEVAGYKLFNARVVQLPPGISPPPFRSMRMAFSSGSEGTQPPAKRRRGRPRKYAPDEIAVSSPKAVTGTQPQFGDGIGGLRSEGGPVSGKKSQMDDSGSGGIGFTPHIITVEDGEGSASDAESLLSGVSSKIMSFSQHGPRSVCILSANAAISNVTLCQAAILSGGSMTYESCWAAGLGPLASPWQHRSLTGLSQRASHFLCSLQSPSLYTSSHMLLSRCTPIRVSSSAGSDAVAMAVIVGSFMAGGPKEPKLISPNDPAMAFAKFASVGLLLTVQFNLVTYLVT